MDEVKKPSKLRRYWKETVRVLRVTKKPNRNEYKAVVKVTSLGMAIIGLLGFAIFIVVQLLF
ncbi:MAG: protein translocase SEC61 complex subunit gamma [Nanoarchaeota archaeon]|nr:protein translocase SEC61 complex subunit gamma [Nanoarchaeota archaeon]MBU1623146.1 protein translocase SEC61 complex subunit gamma [Nanoarchaeota archaeon]MBU1973871.1 protein translocase SEC61 complex subunit gamma [Nanoarchaeota archaeon]